MDHTQGWPPSGHFGGKSMAHCYMSIKEVKTAGFDNIYQLRLKSKQRDGGEKHPVLHKVTSRRPLRSLCLLRLVCTNLPRPHRSMW